MTAAELERLAREQRRALLAIARRRARTDQDAEDAVQQALAIAVRHRERIRPQTALAYVGVIAQHETSRCADRPNGCARSTSHCTPTRRRAPTTQSPRTEQPTPTR